MKESWQMVWSGRRRVINTKSGQAGNRKLRQASHNTQIIGLQASVLSIVFQIFRVEERSKSTARTTKAAVGFCESSLCSYYSISWGKFARGLGGFCRRWWLEKGCCSVYPSVGFLRSRGTSIEAYYKVSRFFLRGSIRNQDTTVKICLLIRSAL